MKAVLSLAAGGPETLVVGDAPDPVAGEGQVLISVRRCGVNYPDLLLIEGRYQFKVDWPFSPGGEVSGIVEAVGAGVTRFRAGDRIIGTGTYGGMAQKIAVPAERCYHIPAAMSFDEAAAIVMTYGTAYYALVARGGVQAGDKVLVLGAAGGVGLAAVEIATALGAQVVAAASSEDKVAVAKAHGAVGGVVYPRQTEGAGREIAGLFKQACGPDGANIVFDPVGGDYAEPALRAIAVDGRYLVVGFTAGIPKIPLNLALLKSCQIVGVFWGAFANRDRAANDALMAQMFALYERGAIKPNVSEVFSLERAGEAIRALAERKAVGKIVVAIQD